MRKQKKSKKLTFSEKCSIAGSAGAASRWQNHKKIPTTHMRIYKDDYAYLVDLSYFNRVPVVLMVHRFIQYIRDNHGLSKFWSSDND